MSQCPRRLKKALRKVGAWTGVSGRPDELIKAHRRDHPVPRLGRKEAERVRPIVEQMVEYHARLWRDCEIEVLGEDPWEDSSWNWSESEQPVIITPDFKRMAGEVIKAARLGSTCNRP
jgi:hypothetical protein